MPSVSQSQPLRSCPLSPSHQILATPLSILMRFSRKQHAFQGSSQSNFWNGSLYVCHNSCWNRPKFWKIFKTLRKDCAHYFYHLGTAYKQDNVQANLNSCTVSASILLPVVNLSPEMDSPTSICSMKWKVSPFDAAFRLFWRFFTAHVQVRPYYYFQLKSNVGQKLRSLSWTIRIPDRQTDRPTYIQMILYVSNAMHCIGQTITFRQIFVILDCRCVFI